MWLLMTYLCLVVVMNKCVLSDSLKQSSCCSNFISILYIICDDMIHVCYLLCFSLYNAQFILLFFEPEHLLQVISVCFCVCLQMLCCMFCCKDKLYHNALFTLLFLRSFSSFW